MSGKYNYWLLSNVILSEYRKKLFEDEIADSFYRDLEYSTGGLDGVMVVETSSMNIYTARKAT